MDPARLFAEAQRLFAGGDGKSAVQMLDRLPATMATDVSVLHFRALALKMAGQPDEAQKVFECARHAAPRDPQIANNYANLLMQAGRAEAALTLYNEALALQADYLDAQINRALALQFLGRLDDALADLDGLIAGGRFNARVYSARGTILITLGRHDEAADSFDRALAMDSRLPVAIHGRATVALERGEADASERFRTAHIMMPHNDSVILGLAEAMEAEGDPAGIALLSGAVARRLDWTEGLERLARMRAEAGEPDFIDHYTSAIELVGDHRLLRLSLAKILASAERYLEALDVLSPLPEDRALCVLRAFYLGEAGNPQSGLAVLGKLLDVDDAEVLMIAGRLALAMGDLDRALLFLDRAAALAPDVISIWAHCDLAWRAAGDPRADWLSRQDKLIATQSLDLDTSETAAIAEVVRQLHRTHSHPVGQSLRGGTQTRGRLFRRKEPEIRRLYAALTAVIADYVNALPPRDPRHPLLKHRDSSLNITGSWSVRLTGSGFHVQHIHSEGILSSACYLALPRGLKDSTTRDGWLEIGRSPSILDLQLEPIADIEPAVGRVALFPSYLHHGTRPFSSGERLTVAFDVVSG